MKILQIKIFVLDNEDAINKWIKTYSKDIEVVGVFPFVRGTEQKVLVNYYPKPKGRLNKE